MGIRTISVFQGLLRQFGAVNTIKSFLTTMRIVTFMKIINAIVPFLSLFFYVLADIHKNDL